jgi:hypothetical protein
MSTNNEELGPIGADESIPFASYSPKKRTLGASVAVAIGSSVGLGSTGLFLFPIAIVGVLFWYGFGIFSLVAILRAWQNGIRDAKFYGDRIEIKTKSDTRTIPYSEIRRVGKYRGTVYLVFKHQKMRAVSLRNERLGNLSLFDVFSQKVAQGRTGSVTSIQSQTGVSSFRKIFNLLMSGLPRIGLIFALEVIASIAIPGLPFLLGEQASFGARYQQLQSSLSGLSSYSLFLHIFLNNEEVALSNIVPAVGILTFLAATYNTARVVEVIALSRNLNPLLYSLSFFAYPHTWVELSAYAVAVFFSIHIAGYFDVTKEDRPTWGGFVLELIAMVLIVSSILLVAAAFEVSESILGGAFVFALWIILVPIGIGIFMWRRSFERSRNPALS